MPKQQPKENPLKSKNIPQPPAITPSEPESKPATEPYRQTAPNDTEQQNSNTVKQQKEAKPQSSKTAQREKITFYLDPQQSNKVYDMMETFRRRTGIRINQQDMLRRIIDVIDPDSILP